MLRKANCHLSLMNNLRYGSHEVHVMARKHVAKFFVYNTVCNCIFFYFDTACLFDSRNDGSHKVRNAVMYGYIMYLCILLF